jgi:NAD(P)-dependent dehydrogenase (short-subunit alcohol dehydrogenase family)
MGKLDGKIAIVTGTSRGVGVGIARQLLLEGATVVGCSRGELAVLPAAEGIDGAAGRSQQWVCDQGDSHAIDEFVARSITPGGPSRLRTPRTVRNSSRRSRVPRAQPMTSNGPSCSMHSPSR